MTTAPSQLDLESAEVLGELADLASLGFSSRKRRSIGKAIVSFTAVCEVDCLKTDDEIEISVTNIIESANPDEFTAFDSDSFTSRFSLSVFSIVEIVQCTGLH